MTMTMSLLSADSTIKRSMTTNSATSATGTSTGTDTLPTQKLGENDFLNLLMTQMQYQDPTQPMDDSAFVAQLAQFSSLQQMQNVSTGVNTTNASMLIGQTVTATNPTDQSTISGVVNAVTFENGSPMLTIGTTTGVDPSWLTSIK